MVAILFYVVVDIDVLLSTFGAGLDRLLNKLHEFCTSSSLEVNVYKSRIIIFSCNKRKSNQEVFYLDKDPIEMTLGIKIPWD